MAYGPRRLFPADLLGYETAPGGTGTLDLLGPFGAGKARVSTIKGPDGRSLADGVAGIGPRGPNADLWDDAGADSQTAMSFAEPIGRTPLTGRGREMAGQAQGMAGLDAARLAPVPPGPPAQGTPGWMPPGERGGGGPPGGAPGAMQQPTQAPPPQPGMPQLAGVAPKRGGIGSWLSTPAFGAEDGDLLGSEEQPTNRAGLLGDMLLGASAGRGFGGMVQGAAAGLEGAHQNEQARRQQAFENEYRKARLAAESGQSGGLVKVGAGETLVDPTTGKTVFQGQGKAQSYGSLEAAMLSPDQETRARAEQLWREKESQRGQVNPYQQETLELRKRRDQEELALKRQHLDLEARRANRSPGQTAAPAPTLLGKAIAERSALPENSPLRADYDQYIAGLRRGSGSQSGTGAAKFSAGEMAGARKDYRALQKAKGDIETYGRLFEEHGTELIPGEIKGQMEAAYGGGLSAIAAANNTGVIQPGELPMLEKQLLRPGNITTGISELAGVDVKGQVKGQTKAMLDRIERAEKELLDTYGPDQLQGVSAGTAAPPPAPTPAAPAPDPAQDQPLIRSPIQGPAVTDTPQPTEGMSMSDYARLLHRNGLSVEQAKEAARRAFGDG